MSFDLVDVMGLTSVNQIAAAARAELVSRQSIRYFDHQIWPGRILPSIARGASHRSTGPGNPSGRMPFWRQ
jgi:hypothetical protein